MTRSVLDFKEKMLGNKVFDQFSSQMLKLNEIKLVPKQSLQEKKRQFVDLQNNLLKLNEDSFNSFEALVLWNNKKGGTKSYSII